MNFTGGLFTLLKPSVGLAKFLDELITDNWCTLRFFEQYSSWFEIKVFIFPWLVVVLMLKSLVYPAIYLYLGVKRDRCIPFPRALVQIETLSHPGFEFCSLFLLIITVMPHNYIQKEQHKHLL